MIPIKIYLAHLSLFLHLDTLLSFFKTVQNCFSLLPPQVALVALLAVPPLFIFLCCCHYYSCLYSRDEPAIVIQ